MDGGQTGGQDGSLVDRVAATLIGMVAATPGERVVAATLVEECWKHPSRPGKEESIK